MDQGPLVDEQIRAGLKFLNEFDNYRRVKAAYWLKLSDDGRWNLYIISDQIDETNFDIAYGEVLKVSKGIQDPNFDPFQVKLVRGPDPVASAVLELQQCFPGNVAMHHGNRILGGVDVDESYIYPQRPTVAWP